MHLKQPGSKDMGVQCIINKHVYILLSIFKDGRYVLEFLIILIFMDGERVGEGVGVALVIFMSVSAFQ